MTVIAIPKILRERLSDEGADVLVEILDKVEDRAQKVTLEIAEEKFEKRIAQLDSGFEKRFAQLDGKIERISNELKAEIAGTEARLKTEIADTTAKLKTEIADTRANLTKWMFIFWIGQVGTFTAILFAFFRK